MELREWKCMKLQTYVYMYQYMIIYAYNMYIYIYIHICVIYLHNIYIYIRMICFHSWKICLHFRGIAINQWRNITLTSRIDPFSGQTATRALQGLMRFISTEMGWWQNFQKICNVGIRKINHPWLGMVYTKYLWWFGDGLLLFYPHYK